MGGIGAAVLGGLAIGLFGILVACGVGVFLVRRLLAQRRAAFRPHRRGMTIGADDGHAVQPGTSSFWFAGTETSSPASETSGPSGDSGSSDSGSGDSGSSGSSSD